MGYPEDITYPDYNDFINGKTEAKGLPDINSIKSDDNATYKVVALADQKNGYANPGKGSSSGSSNSSNDSKDDSSKSSGSSDSKNDSSDKGDGDAGFSDLP